MSYDAPPPDGFGPRPPDAPAGTGVRSGPADRSPQQGRVPQPGTVPRPGTVPPPGTVPQPGRVPPPGTVPPPGMAPPTRAPRRRGRLARRLVLLVVLLLVAYPLVLLGVGWTALNRTAALGSATVSTPGRTYLVVGSDSRAGLTAAQRKALRTGSTAGQRTDTILLLHVPSGGGPTVLMSVPRDSYVAIPGHGENKINAAFSIGGPALLARTLEQATGIGVDNYVEIGFGGFASMVDAVGGVRICPRTAIEDRRAGLDIAKGCQEADGAVALGYARARYFDPRGDLGRVERQRELLAAIVAKAGSPTTLVNPFRTVPLARSGAGALTVDGATGPLALTRFLLGMRAGAGGGGISLTVPVSGTARRGSAGSVVLWDGQQAAAVFTALREDDTEAVRRFAAPG